MLKRLMHSLYMSAHALCSQHTLALLSPQPGAKFLDLGCFDGKWTVQMAAKLKTADIHGVEILDTPARQARSLGVQVHQFDLDGPWPFLDGQFDVIHSSFVIEHMNSVDRFVSETFRVLKPGGYAITTTENGSSWHNIAAAVLGYQTFSSACCSTKTKGLGNPFALHRGPGETPSSMTHKVIFNYLGFVEIFQAHGFGNHQMRGAGYHPLPAWVGNLDHRHAHFLVLKVTKPESSVQQAERSA